MSPVIVNSRWHDDRNLNHTVPKWVMVWIGNCCINQCKLEFFNSGEFGRAVQGLGLTSLSSTVIHSASFPPYNIRLCASNGEVSETENKSENRNVKHNMLETLIYRWFILHIYSFASVWGWFYSCALILYVCFLPRKLFVHFHFIVGMEFSGQRMWWWG